MAGFSGGRADERRRSGRVAAGGRAADAGGDLPGGDGERRRRQPRGGARLLRRSRGAGAGGRIPRSRRPALLRHGRGLGRLGPALRRAASGRAASVPRVPRGIAPRGRHPRRPALPHPRPAHGSLLRAGDADRGAARPGDRLRRRGARLPLFRRARSPGLRRRHREPRRRGGERGGAGRRRGCRASPAAATSSCRNTSTISMPGTRCRPRRRSASSAAPSSPMSSWTMR